MAKHPRRALPWPCEVIRLQGLSETGKDFFVAAAELFVGMVTTLRDAAFTYTRRPDEYRARVAALRRGLVEADLIARAFMANEDDSPSGASWELQPAGDERNALGRALARWEEVHRAVLLDAFNRHAPSPSTWLPVMWDEMDGDLSYLNRDQPDDAER